MFAAPDDYKTPKIPARKPERGFSSFWEGIGAGFSAEALETNYYNQRGRREHDVYEETRAAVMPHLSDDEAAEIDRLARYDRNGRKRQAKVLEFAEKYQGAIGDQSGAALFASREAINAEAQRRAQEEHQDAMDTLDYMRGWRGTAEFVGRGGAAATDATSLGLAAVSGGSGSIARIIAREALMGAVGEAAILPRMYDQAEYLDIENPNPIAQIALGAAFSGALAGGGKVLTRAGRTKIAGEFTRAMQYAKGRNKTVPIDADVGDDSALAEIAAAEDALDAGQPVPERPMPPLLMREEDIANPIVPDQGDIELPDLAALEREVADAEAALNVGKGKSERLLARHFGTSRRKVKGDWVTERGLQIHPEGEAAQTLRAMGVTPKTRPGLFSKANGIKTLDNQVASEWEDAIPGITDIAGMSDDGLYLDRDGFTQVLGDDLLGNGPAFRMMEDLRIARDSLEEGHRAHEAPEKWIQAQRSFRQTLDPIEDGDWVLDPYYYEELADFGEDYDPRRYLEQDFDEWARDRGYNDYFTPDERNELLNLLEQNGGSAERAMMIMFERQEWAGKAARRAGKGPIDADTSSQARPSQADDGNAQRSADDAGEPQDSGAAPRNAGSPISETTDAGEQLLIDGVAPVTQRERLEAAQSAPMRGGEASLPEGRGSLFGEAGMRGDMFDEGASSKGAETVAESVMQDLRLEIEAEGDFELTFEGKTQPISKWLDELDDDLDFVETAELCGIKGPRQ